MNLHKIDTLPQQKFLILFFATARNNGTLIIRLHPNCYDQKGVKMTGQSIEPTVYISEIQLEEEKPVPCGFSPFFHKSKSRFVNCDGSNGNG
jgi:hypothetical protein